MGDPIVSRMNELRAWRRRKIKKTGKRLIRGLRGFLGRQSTIEDRPVLDPGLFPELEELRASWPLVRKELDEILADVERLPKLQDLSPDQSRIATGDRWRSFPLRAFGMTAERSCARCPETARLIRKIPGMESAWFSILLPGYHIPSHKGITKGILTGHLALRVPDDRERCQIRIGDETRNWTEGEFLIFDDTVSHEVWNESDELRAVLLLDFRRPMRWPGRVFNSLFLAGFRLTGYARDARRNFLAWEREYYGGAGPFGQSPNG